MRPDTYSPRKNEQGMNGVGPRTGAFTYAATRATTSAALTTSMPW